jgi:hypothetical protein
MADQIKKTYTLADLEQAERELREGDSGRHNNLGRTRRWNQAAMERVRSFARASSSKETSQRLKNRPTSIERERVQAELGVANSIERSNELHWTYSPGNLAAVRDGDAARLRGRRKLRETEC